MDINKKLKVFMNPYQKIIDFSKKFLVKQVLDTDFCCATIQLLNPLPSRLLPRRQFFYE